MKDSIADWKQFANELELKIRLLKLEEAIERSNSIIKDLEKDVFRYRWLRECAPYRTDRTISVVVNKYQNGKFNGTLNISLYELDAAIDEAMRG
ncbi:MAG: hypothetical protein A3F67_10900 [Verrucomicrobia bacterium RIFCSPHIGHO2_12_FULL_41_10]|nr:MAG: hypothetical protein A3F67_10900 [Verrucomicrobia bacterium RIFCSPHIGHO2_12_FULL_41_10]